MDFPTQWLYQQHGGTVLAGRASCYLCGASCTEEYSTAKGIADTFNSHYLARAPSSAYLCAACAWYLDNKAGHPEFRKMSLMVWKTGWKQWERATMKQDIEGTLQHGTGADVFLVCSLTKKKHILLQAPLNAQGSTTLALQVEEQVAYLSLLQWREMDARFMALLAFGHNKGEILSGNLYASTLKKHGKLFDALRLSEELGPYRQSPALELLSYVTIIEKESEKEEDGTVPNRDDDGRPSPALRSGSRPLVVGVDRDRLRVQEQVPDGHLDTVRDDGRRVQPHDDEPRQVSQQPLW